jgi:hypothetical protein
MTNGAVSGSRMTNGAVSGSRMTNGAASGSRMTNGAVAATGNGSSLTVGSQQIEVPAGTPVTIMAETKQPLHVGQQIMVVAKKQPNGSFNGSDIISMDAK